MRTLKIIAYVWKRMFCKHDYKFSHNIFGDEINHVDGKRSWWKCSICGDWKAMEALTKGDGI